MIWQVFLFKPWNNQYLCEKMLISAVNQENAIVELRLLIKTVCDEFGLERPLAFISNLGVNFYTLRTDEPVWKAEDVNNFIKVQTSAVKVNEIEFFNPAYRQVKD